jgi:hypothetical protein
VPTEALSEKAPYPQFPAGLGFQARPGKNNHTIHFMPQNGRNRRVPPRQNNIELAQEEDKLRGENI